MGNDCSAKLFYTKKPEYANQTLDDPFLLALAEGGHLVGELAKHYFPDGQEITEKETQTAVQKTTDLLAKDTVTLFEAAITFENFLIRADVVIKTGDTIKIFEVKSKSIDGSEPPTFRKKKGGILASWEPYLYDIAFQKFVTQNTYPDHKISAHLMLIDKSVECPTDGLNQKFRITKNQDGQKQVTVTQAPTQKDLTPPILTRINVDNECDEIINETKHGENRQLTFAEHANLLAEHYKFDKKMAAPVTKKCGKCEYKATKQEETAGLKNGLKECWKQELGWKNKDFEEQTVFDVWNFSTKDKLIRDNKIKMSDIELEDIKPEPDDNPGISSKQRRWLQINKHQTQDNTVWVDKQNLAKEMGTWTYPLHFIDFETNMAAIPFNKGRRPYEGIAFQFSHHSVDQHGTVKHAGQFLNTTPGQFPNYKFIRELKNQLGNDNGSIFMYSPHENTFLNTIHKQLLADQNKIEDAKELTDFIETISNSTKNSETKWAGERQMVDMLKLVKRYYYDPKTKGSNSIKQVLPAILNRSEFLQQKYSQPTYGTEEGIASTNFKNWQWIQYEDKQIIDPYKLLPKMFTDISEKDLNIIMDENLNNGGAALTAYAKMQYEDMSNEQSKEIEQALLKYCELDTLAMVMIYQEWKHLV